MHLLEFIHFLTSVLSVREFMAFTSEVLAERTEVGERRTVKEQGEPKFHHKYLCNSEI